MDEENPNNSIQDIVKHDDDDLDDYNKNIEKLTIRIMRGDEALMKKMLSAYDDLVKEYSVVQKVEETKKRNLKNQELLKEKTAEKINMLNNSIKICMDEIAELRSTIRVERNKNISVRGILESSTINKLNNMLLQVDLIKLDKFKAADDSRDVSEILIMLKGNGGEFLKKLGSILYFLKLLKKRYMKTKIPQEIEVS